MASARRRRTTRCGPRSVAERGRGAVRMRLISRSLLVAALTLGGAAGAQPIDSGYVTTQPGGGRFPLSADGRTAPLYVSAQDYAGVLRAANDLRTDLERVTKDAPRVVTDGVPNEGPAVIVGTIGKSALVDRLVRERKIDTSGVANRWETYLLQVVDRPLPGVDRALVIAGSDKRGTI